MKQLLVVLVILTASCCSGVSGQNSSVEDRCAWCVQHAQCVEGECRCPTPFVGSGYFFCWLPSRWDVCQVCDDPVLTTEHGENVALSYLNSTLLVDKFVLRLVCRLRVTETRQRVRGKSLPRCINVRLDRFYTTGRLACSIEFKIIATVTIGVRCSITWTIYVGFQRAGGANDIIKLRKWMAIKDTDNRAHTLNACQCALKFQVSKGRILHVDMPCCFHKLGFRPVVRKLFWLKGGFFLRFQKVNPLSLPPAPLPLFFPLCLRPGYTVSHVAERLGLPNTRHAMSFLAMTNLPRDLVGVSPARLAMVDALRNCSGPERQTLMDEVSFVYSSAPFIREVSGTTDGYGTVMDLMTKAAEWFCEGDVLSCRSILSTISNDASDLVLDPIRFPSLAAFVDKNCTVV